MSLQSLLDSSSSLEISQYPDLQDRLKAVLQGLLSEARELLTLSFTRDYRQHSIITLSSALKHKTQKLFGAFLALVSRWGREEEDEGEESGGGEREGEGGVKLDKEKVISERVKAVKKTAQDLKREVNVPHLLPSLSLPSLSLLSPYLSPHIIPPHPSPSSSPMQ